MGPFAKTVEKHPKLNPYPKVNLEELRNRLYELADPNFSARLSGFGIDNSKALGIRTPVLKALAKEIGKSNGLALEAWAEPEHEMTLMAIFIAEGKTLPKASLEKWVKESYSWDLVDQACTKVYQRHPEAWELAFEWAAREPEYERRAGLVLMTAIAIHHKKRPDASLWPFFEEVHRYACDPRNFVKKANNWLLRTLGKRSLSLHPKAIELAQALLEMECPAAKWTARDALRELQSDKIQERLRKKGT